MLVVCRLQLMLHFFVLIAPVAVGVFTASASSSWHTMLLAVFLAFFINSNFTAMWLVANELEDPFGLEANDIPMMSFHHEFCASLQVPLAYCCSRCLLYSDATPHAHTLQPVFYWRQCRL